MPNSGCREFKLQATVEHVLERGQPFREWAVSGCGRVSCAFITRWHRDVEVAAAASAAAAVVEALEGTETRSKPGSGSVSNAP